MNIKVAFLTFGALALPALPIAALAQPVPQYAQQTEQIRGTIASIAGQYTIYVRDDRGYVDTVQLHDGTIINPTGLTLASGQSVTILGSTDGRQFDADEIDTPYTIDDGYAPADVAPYVVEPYPYYDTYPAYALAYPAFISLGFNFGGGYGGHGYGGHGYGGHGYSFGGRGGYGTYGHSGYVRGNSYSASAARGVNGSSSYARSFSYSHSGAGGYRGASVRGGYGGASRGGGGGGGGRGAGGGGRR
jgi:hypothetical protein